MNLRSFVLKMRRDVVRYEAEFARGRERHAALGPFPTLAALLDRLPLPEQTAPADKHAITTALVIEYSASRSPIWSALLVIAFEPMLAGLFAKAHEVPHEERAGLVIGAFLEAATSAARHRYLRSLPGFLKSMTLLNLRHALTVDAMNADAEFVAYDEDRTCASPRALFDNPLDETLDRRKRAEVERAAKKKAMQTRERAEWRTGKARRRAEAKRVQGAA